MSVQKVISNGYCIGCGNCALAYDDEDNPYEISNDEVIPYVNLDKPSKGRVEDDVCVFSPSFTLSEIDQKNGSSGISCDEDSIVGENLGVYAGRVTNEEILKKSSSGGLTTLILEKLFSNGLIDGVIHVKPSVYENQELFEYGVSYSMNEIQAAKKSRYYLVSYHDVIKSLKNQGGRYAFVGVPCQIEALKSFIEKFPQEYDISFYIGIFCGHQKIPAYTEYLASQVAKKNVRLQNILSVDYRSKDNITRADQYKFELITKNNEKFTQVSSSIFGNDWGIGIFKPKACDFCSNVFGHTADVILGDAWIKPYVSNAKGTNIVIVRDNIIKNILLEAFESGEAYIDELEAGDAYNSQKATYRHRTVGLKQRIEIEESNGNWLPRVERFNAPNASVLDKYLYKFRYLISEKIRTHYEKTKNIRLPKKLIIMIKIFYFTLGSRVFRKLRQLMS